MNSQPLKIQVTKSLLFVNTGIVTTVTSGRRTWQPCLIHGLISAGQTLSDVKYIRKLKVDDIICAYENGKGYLAIGIVIECAVPINQFKLDDGSTLHNKVNMGDGTDKGMFQNAEDYSKCEYVAKIKWFTSNEKPLWLYKDSYGHYAPRNTVADLKWEQTKEKIEEHFEVKFISLNGHPVKLPFK